MERMFIRWALDNPFVVILLAVFLVAVILESRSKEMEPTNPVAKAKVRSGSNFEMGHARHSKSD